MIYFNDNQCHSVEEAEINFFCQKTKGAGNFLEVSIGNSMITLNYGRDIDALLFDLRKLKLLTKTK